MLIFFQNHQTHKLIKNLQKIHLQNKRKMINFGVDMYKISDQLIFLHTFIKLVQQDFSFNSHNQIINFQIGVMATSNQQVLEDARFEEILGLEGIDLQQFYQQAINEELFPDARTYPQFFNQNLVSPSRVLKRFVDNPQSNLRIFYYQILRLGYQIESQSNNNRNFLINLRRIIFHPQFQILFTQQTQDQRDLFNDFQFKKLFAQFIVLLNKQQAPNVEEVICHYPIMDTILVHILRSLLASQNINQQFDVKIPTEVVFSQLASLMQLSVTSYGNCWKFEDSDMFCYQQNENQLYLAYIVEQQAEEEGVQQLLQTNNFQNKQQYAISTQQQDSNFAANNIDLGSGNTSINKIPLPNPQSNPSPYAPPSVDFNNNYQYQPSYKPYEPPTQPYHNNYSAYGPSDMNKSMNSQRPTESMISQKYQFTDYLGVTTTQKHKVPKHRQQASGLAKNYDGFLNKVEDNIKSSFLYNNTIPNNQYRPAEQKDSYNPSFQPSSYFSNSYEVNKSYDYKPLQSKSEYKTDFRSDYTSNNQYDYKPYISPYSNTYSQDNKIYQSSNKYGYGSSDLGSAEYSSYKPGSTSVFKPVEPTPLPTFDGFKSYHAETRKQYIKPSTSYETYASKPSYDSNSYFSTATFQKNDYTKPSYNPNDIGDYYKDFTSPDILSKLRVENRQNIDKIRESMKGIYRGAQLPPDFDVRKSAIHSNTNPSAYKDQLYRNQSRSHFQYNESYKTGSSRLLAPEQAPSSNKLIGGASNSHSNYNGSNGAY